MKTELDFERWFAAFNLGPLEDVRDYVEANARQNAFDAEDVWQCAIDTVKLYVDDPDTHSAFDYFRAR